MYNPPIEVVYGQVMNQIDDNIFKAVMKYNINVDKEELLRALRFDRQQYENGYADGKEAMLEELAEKICKSYEECVEGECPGFAYCRHNRKGVLVWLQKVLNGETKKVAKIFEKE